MNTETPEQFIERVIATPVKEERAKLLAETDWYVVRQSETGDAIPQEILDYRQALRDITSQEKYPYVVIWPAKPA
jgi:hypothetical protein